MGCSGCQHTVRIQVQVRGGPLLFCQLDTGTIHVTRYGLRRRQREKAQHQEPECPLEALAHAFWVCSGPTLYGLEDWLRPPPRSSVEILPHSGMVLEGEKLEKYLGSDEAARWSPHRQTQ